MKSARVRLALVVRGFIVSRGLRGIDHQEG